MHWVNTREKEGPKGTLKGKYKNVLKMDLKKKQEKKQGALGRREESI